MNFSTLNTRKDLSIVLCGAAGQGIKTVEQFLTHIFHDAGYYITATKEYMSRVRGGTNSTELRVSSTRVRAFVERIDIFIPLTKAAIARQKRRLTKETVIICEPENIPPELSSAGFQFIEIPWTTIAQEIGNKIFSNIIAAGVIAELFNIEKEIAEDYLRKRFALKGEEMLSKNFDAYLKGCELAQQLKEEKGIQIAIPKNPAVRKELMFNGAEVVGMGAIAGGCNFICSYPMSPSTGVLIHLAQHSHDFDILVEQAEDELAAINASLGASYAGARAMVTTSGGGFALMSEGLSLSGMTETPIVIHLAQRPGPATGLPTRTEQGDLELALYSGHGDFPRVILAPGTLEDAFYLTQKAFNIAAKFQVPVIILTDQYFMDLYYNFPSLDLSKITIEQHIISTDKNYKRYALTPDGVSPRGIPGFGEGIVRVDSDEHDEEGFITEDLENTRVKMVQKRLQRLKTITKNALLPELRGSKNYQTLVIGWGSTYTAINEALKSIRNDSVAFLHFKQVYPLHPKTKEFLAKAKTTIVIENNVTGQFAKLLTIFTGETINHKILKYNGLPFSVEELEEKITTLLEEE